MQQMPTRVKEYKEVAFYLADSLESENEFGKLHENGKPTNIRTRVVTDEDEEMAVLELDKIFSIISRTAYQDQLAPFDTTEDHSTASMLKNKGPNLTMEMLSKLSAVDILQRILTKASIIDFERLARLLKTAFSLAKYTIPLEDDLITDLITKFCYVSDRQGAIICKSSLKYD